ncbi:MAG: HAMP domain-containing histidine kinase [Clostridiales bacterium]|nr:HAMP domain-containing histidine kinase [Clostridiales bacterium]
MAGKENMTQTKKMTSIVRKLHWSFLRKQIGTFFKMDILFMFLLFWGWILTQEITCIGEISFFYDRGIEREGYWKEWVYYVQEETGKYLLRLRLYDGVRIIGFVVICLIIMQILSLFFSYNKEEKHIRRILNPINELALKADTLNRMSFSEDKYQIIEEAITNIQPEEEKQLSFGDKDLAGIEVAMNNLLIRMQDVYRQQARFVNDASHELRTPIAVIEGYVNMLARWGVEDEKVLTESIAALQRESGHMKHLVEQLLFLARGDSGKTQLEFTRTSLKDCMQEIYEESLLIDEEHVYRYKVPKEDMVVLADTMMLKQAVRILVDNAAKYTKLQDEIILSVGRTEKGDFYLQVQDTGIGMEEADIAHMFERFYRSDDARKYKGTGLGLSIAKWIVDKHQGYFEILSRTELGTRIRIVLPRDR